MLKIIPPKSVSTGKTYCGASSDYKPVKIVKQAEKSIESRPIETTYMVDEAGCITTDASKARSIFYQEVKKDGRIVIHQKPVSSMDREIARLWNIVKELDKGVQERELMWQKINKELDRADQLLEEDKKTSYWAYTADGIHRHTWEE